MKRKFKLFSLFGAFALSAVALASCGGGNKGAIDTSKSEFNVGILQLATHDALGAATTGFKDYINNHTPEGKSVTFTFKNPEGDAPTLLAMANQLVRDCDLVLGNATSAITQLVSSAATEGLTRKPLLFTSVTDPVTSNIVLDWANHPGVFITGTSDINPVQAQMELAFEAGCAKDGTVDKIGFLYNIGEINSRTQCDMAINYLATAHPTCQTAIQTVSESNQISAAAQALVNAGCDYIYLPTDNMIASNVSAVTNITNPAKVPVMCGEEGMVNSGGTFTYSISYYELGMLTGKMACQIMFEGISADLIAIEGLTDASKMSFACNTDAITAMGLQLSQEFKTKYNIE